MRRAMPFALLIALMLPGAVHAATTSRLTGQVVGTDSAPVAGATVQLWSEVLIGGRQSATSDDDGRFAFNLLPPGPYTVRAERAGFVPVDVAARVALDRETQVQLVLVATDFAGEIEVSAAAPVIDTTQVSGGASYGEDYLRKAAVGVQGRDWLAVLLQTPGATTVAGEETPTGVMKGKNPRVMGSTQSENAYLLDWMNVTDPLYATFGTWLNYDAIHEVSVEETGLDAEYGLALGGVINLVTKSGGNSFSGSVDVRYRDHHMNEAGEHFDPDVDPSSTRALSATLGGPILRDRLWFFAAYGQYLEETTPTNSLLTHQMDRRDWITKLTWQASDNNRVVFKATGFPVDDQNFNADYDIGKDAGARQRSDVHIAQAELQSVLGNSLLLTVQAGINRASLDVVPTTAEIGAPRYYNEDADLWFGNMYLGTPNGLEDLYSVADTDRDQAQASLTWFVDDVAGRHELKLGATLQKTEHSYIENYPGVHTFFVYESQEVNPDGSGLLDEDGDGYTDHTLWRGTYPANEGRQTADLRSFFLQDSWRPLANLTAKLGLRLDTVEHVNTGGVTVADMERWQPRLGLAWDPLGDGKQVARASWGRSMHPGAVSFVTAASYLAGGYASEYRGYEWYCGERHWCDHGWLTTLYGEPVVTFDEHGNEHYWYLVEQGWQVDGVLMPTLDMRGLGQLEAPWVETWTLGLERELWPGASVELEYVNKKTRDLIEDTAISNTWIWDDSEPEPSYDDPSTWPGLSAMVFANVADARRDYEAAVAKLETRSTRYYAKASYTWSRSRGGSTTEAWEGYQHSNFDAFPAYFANTWGYLPGDRRHVVKLSGYALLPWDLTLSAAFAWGSAPPIDSWSTCWPNGTQLTADRLEGAGYDPVIADYCQEEYSTAGHLLLLEPRGSDRGRASYNLDLGIAKAFHLGPTTLELNLAILNATDSERPDQYQEWEFQTLEHGKVTDWTQPRSYQVGVRIDF